MNCPANLCPQNNAQTIPATDKDPSIPAKVPDKSEDQPAKTANVPLKPVEPIKIPKENPNEDERLKQLESPETVELIKTFEIPDHVNDKPEKVANPQPPLPASPVVVVKPQPVVAPEPPKVAPVDPMASLVQQEGNKPTKDLKEATADFLAQEYSQPKRSSKRYTKSRQKNNHS